VPSDKSETHSELLVEIDEAVAVVTINRPKVLNALNIHIVDALGLTMHRLKSDDTVRTVVITGAGDRAFVAGADINELCECSSSEAHAYAVRGQSVFNTIEQMGKPVIAAINGFALGGGCELAMACTLRLAADSAVLGLPEVKLGIIPGYGGTQRLARLVGKGRAMEMILRGRQVDAEEAFKIGLVNQVVPFVSLMSETRLLAVELAAGAPLALRYAIEALNCASEMTFSDGCAHEALLFGSVMLSDDMQEGTRAFLDKRKPSFRGK